MCRQCSWGKITLKKRVYKICNKQPELTVVTENMWKKMTVTLYKVSFFLLTIFQPKEVKYNLKEYSD